MNSADRKVPLIQASPPYTALTFVLAPLPNSICSRCARADEISPEYNSAYIDFGRFLTGMLVVSGQAEEVTLHLVFLTS